MFGRDGQSHVCAPAMSVGDYFAGRPLEHRAICDEVVRVLDEVGQIQVEAVSVGILMKRRGTFAELRPRYDHLALSFILRRRLDHPRITRRTSMGRGSGRTSHAVPLRTVADIDDEVRAWLAESYFESGR